MDSGGSGKFPVNSSDCCGIDGYVRIIILTNDATTKRNSWGCCIIDYEGSTNDVICASKVLSKLGLHEWKGRSCISEERSNFTSVWLRKCVSSFKVWVVFIANIVASYNRA